MLAPFLHSPQSSPDSHVLADRQRRRKHGLRTPKARKQRSQKRLRLCARCSLTIETGLILMASSPCLDERLDHGQELVRFHVSQPLDRAIRPADLDGSAFVAFPRPTFTRVSDCDR